MNEAVSFTEWWISTDFAQHEWGCEYTQRIYLWKDGERRVFHPVEPKIVPLPVEGGEDEDIDIFLEDEDEDILKDIDDDDDDIETFDILADLDNGEEDEDSDIEIL